MNVKQLVNNFFMEQGTAGAQNFSINVAISNLKGNEEVQWTTSYQRKCKRVADEYERKICKLESQWSAINLLVSRMVSLRADCRKSSNPKGCMETLQRTMLSERAKQRKLREMISQIRRQKDEALRNKVAAQRQQQVAQ